MNSLTDDTIVTPTKEEHCGGYFLLISIHAADDDAATFQCQIRQPTKETISINCNNFALFYQRIMIVNIMASARRGAFTNYI